MKTVRYVTGLALLSSGCAVDSAYVPPPVEPLLPEVALVHQQLPPSQVLLADWELPMTNPWFRYFKFTLLSALDDRPTDGDLPDVAQLELVHRAECAATSLATAGLPQGALFVVDLRGAASVAFGSTLSRHTSVALVPTFNNWPAENELIPAEETLAAMINMPPQLPSLFEHATPVFLLDAWRLAYRDQAPVEGAVDNRYMLSPADLPDAETLKRQGITQIIYVVEERGGTTVEEDDLHVRFGEYQASGIPISMIDVGGACELQPDGERLYYYESRFEIVPREICTSSSEFYRRSPGGFGGRHAAPTHLGWHTGGFRGGFSGGFRGGFGG